MPQTTPILTHIWHQNEAGGWAIAPLEGDSFVLAGRGEQSLLPRPSDHSPSGALLLRSGMGSGCDTGWTLLVGRETAASVNGDRVLAGIRVLRHRDEITVRGAGRLFFSTEQLAQAQPFPGAAQAVFCARCKQEIARLTSAVRCPGCGTWCHQSDDLPCWTYAPACPLCDQATALDVGYRWTPEEL